MSDRPTYWDYLFHTENRYTKSGGRYYMTAKEKTSIRTWVFLGIYIAAVAALIVLGVTNIIWPAWVGELWLLYIPMQIVITKYRYNHARFVPVAEDTEDWQKAAKRSFSVAGQVMWIVFALLNIVFYSSGSFTVSYIRSQLDNNAVIEMDASGGERYFSDENSSDRRVPYAITSFNDDIYIDISVLHTPHTARLSLDGQPLPQKDQPQKSVTTILNLQDYFEQETYFPIPADMLHEGSVLTLTCGDLVREWVFDVADKEGV